TVATNLMDFQPDELFDAVLLDAPCSSTGTVRRHPDIPWTKTPEDIAKLAELQQKLIERAITLVRADGTVVFSNCSLDPSEGEDLVRDLVEKRADVMLDPIREEELPGMEHFVTWEGFLRTTPDVKGAPGQLVDVDGFFAARFRRRS